MSGLREALAGRLADDDWTCEIDELLRIAALPEHRDEVRALIGDEQVEGIELCVEHDEPAVEGYDPMGFCRSGETDCRTVPVYAPREES